MQQKGDWAGGIHMGIFIVAAVLFLSLMAVLYVFLYNASEHWPSSVQRPLRAGFATLQSRAAFPEDRGRSGLPAGRCE